MLQGSHSNAGLPRQLIGKESAVSAGATGNMSSIPGWGRSPGAGNGNALQYFCLENPMDRGAWGLQSLGSQGQTRLNSLHTQQCCQPQLVPAGKSGL